MKWKLYTRFSSDYVEAQNFYTSIGFVETTPYLNIIFKKATLEDAEKLLAVQRESFKEALELYQDFDTNPKYEKIEKIVIYLHI